MDEELSPGMREVIDTLAAWEVTPNLKNVALYKGDVLLFLGIISTSPGVMKIARILHRGKDLRCWYNALKGQTT